MLLFNVNSSEKGNSTLYCLIKTGRILNVRHLYSSRDFTTLFKDRKLKECWGLV